MRGKIVLFGFRYASFQISLTRFFPVHDIRSLVTSLFHKDDRLVRADPESEFFEYLVNQGQCSEDGASCTGFVYQFVDVFFGFQYAHDHWRRNAIILGAFLSVARSLTFLSLKYIRFS